MSHPLKAFLPRLLHVLLFIFVTTTVYLHLQLSKMPKSCNQPIAFETLVPTTFQPGGIWTVNSAGRLGNQMGEYATLFALAKLNGHQAYISPEMHNYLAPIFRITLPVLPTSVAQQIPWQNYALHDWMSEEYLHIDGDYVSLTGFPCSWTFYHHLREEIRREFTLHDHIRKEAQAYLWGIKKNQTTFVGVHVRRGDYVYVMPQLWKGVVADKGYLEQAMNQFRARYNDALFVVTSNDMAWCWDNIDNTKGDVIFAGDGKEGSPEKDFALLTQCNHTIMTIGTFGIWAAYLVGGETIYLANYTLPDSPFLKIFRPEAAFLPEWVGIPADLSPLLK
ncbi:galactoside alpha-(1,2)-fucosyltransferase 2-like [Macrotis lagotis]|uniref:galactoside alpha-(1,2)-fucosyltransferase 2-like n=1 Tax=Macrotis lagotis TaxID=92651 RepID=UPI003D68DDF9